MFFNYYLLLLSKLLQVMKFVLATTDWGILEMFCSSHRLLGCYRHPDYAVFQLGIFLRALRPARTVLRPARLYSALPEFKKKTKKIP